MKVSSGGSTGKNVKVVPQCLQFSLPLGFTFVHLRGMSAALARLT